jgi:hypothetical protein
MYLFMSIGNLDIISLKYQNVILMLLLETKKRYMKRSPEYWIFVNM